MILGHAIELVGKVQTDLTIKVISAVDFGTNLGRSLQLLLRHIPYSGNADFVRMSDFNIYDSLVEVNNLYKEIFYD